MSDPGQTVPILPRCIVASCTFAGTHEVEGQHGGSYFYCDDHYAFLARARNLTPPGEGS